MLIILQASCIVLVGSEASETRNEQSHMRMPCRKPMIVFLRAVSARFKRTGCDHPGVLRVKNYKKVLFLARLHLINTIGPQNHENWRFLNLTPQNAGNMGSHGVISHHSNHTYLKLCQTLFFFWDEIAWSGWITTTRAKAKAVSHVVFF